MKQEGPKLIVIPEQRFMSCYGCQFHEHSLVRSGRDPIYKDDCRHEKSPVSGITSGNLHKGHDDHLIAPSWCPFLPKQEKRDTAGTPGHGTSGNFMRTQIEEHG